MKGSVRKRGSSWSYYFDLGTVDGKRQKKEKGGFKTKKAAEQALTAAMNEYNNGGQVFTPSEITLSDYFDLWFDQYVKMNTKVNTQINYLSVIENHLKPAFGRYKLKALSPATVQEYINGLKIKGFARNTVSNILTTLSGSIEYAIEPLRFIQYNPCDRVKMPRYENKRQELHIFLTPENMEQIFERFPESSPFYVPLMIGYHTGLRISECFGLCWSDIDLKKCTLTVSRQVTKRNFGSDVRQTMDRDRKKMERSRWYFQTPKTESSNRTVTFGQTLQTVLTKAKKDKQENRLEYGEHFTEYYLTPEKDEKGDTVSRILPVSRGVAVDLAPADLVCVRSDGSMLSPDSFRYVNRICRDELHIPFNYHSLRHTHATMLIEAGANVKDVQERLGHARIQTTMDKYVHDTEEMKAATAALFEQIALKQA